MLIDGEKWACEACVRGHRVTTCKHHDRPLIRIARKGRPFSTCSVCNCTPCQAPEEHTKLRREAESKSQSSKKASGRPSSRSNSAFLPIAPRPSLDSPTPSASHAATPTPLPGTHPSAGSAVPARPRLSPRPRSSTDTDTQTSMTRHSPGHASSHEHAHAQAHSHPRHHHLHSGARSTAPALPLPVFTTTPPPPSHFPLSCGSFATPALASVADIPVSLPMMDADGQGFLFGDGTGGYAGDGVFSLDDLDVVAGALHVGMMQSEWGDQFWLGDESV